MKNNIKYLLLTLFLFSLHFLKAQRSYQIKLYNSMQYSYSVKSYPYEPVKQTTESIQLFKLLPGFSVQKGRSGFDIFITSLSHQNFLNISSYSDSLNIRDFKYRVTSFDLGLQFIRSWYLKSSNNNRLNYILGAGLEPLFSQYSTIRPYNPDPFKAKSTGYTINTCIIPRISYNLTPKFTIEITAPLKIIQMVYNRQWVNNPFFTYSQQHTSNFNVNVLPKQFILNMGIACKL